MKTNKFFLLKIIISLFFVVLTGSTCANGQQSQPGSVETTNKVIASKWFKVDSSVWKHTDADSSQYLMDYYIYTSHEKAIYLDTEITFHATIPTSLITQQIKDSGLVLFYIKDSTGNGDANMVGKAMQITPVARQDYEGRFKSYTTATNRLNKSDYFFFQCVSDTLGQSISIETYWTGSDAKYENTSGHKYTILEGIKYQDLPLKQPCSSAISLSQ